MRGIVRGRYAIATFIKPELITALDSYTFQEIGKKAVQQAVRIREDDAIAVPIEKVEKTLENAVRKVVYVDRETHEKWVEFPKILKNYLHYWVNVKFNELRNTTPINPAEQKEKGKDFTLAFYLFHRTHELYTKGLMNGSIILESLAEVYEQKDELQPLEVKEYSKLSKELGGTYKIYVNFKNHEELRDWYADLPLTLKRAVWVKVNDILLDKLKKVWYNILYQNQQEVSP